MKNINVFIHDATPTWSGFVYQGYVACYLTLKEINKMKEENQLTLEEIGENYGVELEYCEDIAILCTKTGEYLSIHQVKHEKAESISKYRDPIVQLMLEKGYCSEKGLGTPKAYLHTSSKIKGITSKNDLPDRANQWKQEIHNFYKELENIYDSLSKCNEEEKTGELAKLIEKEPLKFNRTAYKDNIKALKELCTKDVKDYEKILSTLEQTCRYLREDLCVDKICNDVNIYQYGGGAMSASPYELWKSIKESIKEYKKDIPADAKLQVGYIANKILNFMRIHILERHEAIRQGNEKHITIPFSNFIEVLNESLGDYEEEGNRLLLKGIYEREMAEHCKYCKYRCDKDGECVQCKIANSEFMKLNLSDTDFSKFCYSLNPDCRYSLRKPEAIHDLLNKDGLDECVFKLAKEVPEERFSLHSNEKRFMIKNHDKNVLISAISTCNREKLVENIMEGISNNPDTVSLIFDAEQIVTTRLDAPSKVWEYNFTEVETAWKETHEGDEYSGNSYLEPRKPEFISVDKILQENHIN